MKSEFVIAFAIETKSRKPGTDRVRVHFAFDNIERQWTIESKHTVNSFRIFVLFT